MVNPPINPATHPSNRHDDSRRKSYAQLDQLRKAAEAKGKYNSAQTRAKMCEECVRRCGFVPHPEQLDLAECILLSLDCTAVARTGWGKTIPFALPLFVRKNKIHIIITPLNALGEDQAQRFHKMGLTAIALTKKTYDDQVHKDIEKGRYQVVLVSPELALDTEDRLRPLLRDPHFSKRVGAFIVDEAHCITQWGDGFRSQFAELGTLRAFSTPVLALSATLTPAMLAQVRKTMHIQAEHSFHLNLGNDRPNIYWEVRRMNGSENDFNSLAFLLPENLEVATKLPKTMIFFDSIDIAMKARRWFSGQVPERLRDRLKEYFAPRPQFGKELDLGAFNKDEVDILFTTEAAGMGCDFPKVEIVVQYLVPRSLSIWTQRAGRGGRQKGLCSRAVLLVQPSVFQEKGKTTRKEGDPIMYVKTVEEWLRKWIETTGCRRDIADTYFDNPQPRESPVGPCCDNCLSQVSSSDAGPTLPPPSTSTSMAVSEPPPSAPPPSTPQATAQVESQTASVSVVTAEPSTSSLAKAPPSAADTSEVADSLVLPSTRRDAYLQEARALLEVWRHDVWLRCYRTRPFGAPAILPDTVITALAYRVYQTAEDLKTVKWSMAQRHGQEVFDLLHELDVKHARKKHVAEMVKKAAEQAEREARQKEREEARKHEQAEKAAKKAAAQALKQAEAERRQQEKQERDEEKKRQRELGQPSQRPSRAKRARVSHSATVSSSLQSANTEGSSPATSVNTANGPAQGVPAPYPPFVYYPYPFYYMPPPPPPAS